MSKLLAIEYRNFQSYGNAVTRINLDFSKAVLVIGRNLDSVVEGQIDSNGSGKSAMRQAIIFGAYGQTITPASGDKLKQDDLLNIFNGKDMMVALELHADDGFFYRIERYYKDEKFKNGVYLLRKQDVSTPWNRKSAAKGGHDITDAGKRDVNKEIIRIIGLPFSVFSRLIVISATHTPFLSLDLSAQREIMEELFGFTELSEKAEELKEWMKTNKAELATLERLDEQIKAEHERYEKSRAQISNNIDAWNKQLAREQSILKQKIDEYAQEYGDTDFDIEEEKFHDIRKLETSITEATSKIKLASAELNTLEGQLDLIKGWDKTHIRELKNLEKTLAEPLLFEDEEQIEAFNDELGQYDTAIASIDKGIVDCDKTMSDISNNIKLILSEIKVRNQPIQNLVTESRALTDELKSLRESKCPYCAQHLHSTNESISEKEEHQRSLAKTITTQREDVELLEAEITVKNTARDESLGQRQMLQEHKLAFHHGRRKLLIDVFGDASIDLKTEYKKTRERQKLTTELERLQNETNPFLKFGSMDEIETRIETTNAAIRKLNHTSNRQKVELEILTASLACETMKELSQVRYQLEAWNVELEKSQALVNPYMDGLVQLETSPPSPFKTEEIEALKDMLEHQDVALKLLTKKDSFVRKALLNRYLPKLNKRVRYYLSKIGMPHKVEFQQDMSVTITQGRTAMKFAQMSAGQAARINISLAFAFRDILQSRFGSINFCVLDECLDVGLGSVGVTLAAKMVKAVAKENNLSMLVISHKDEIASMFDARLTVEMKNRFSKVVQSDI
jgi:DNA repair exonuclease SbcCD ATPase subunit